MGSKQQGLLFWLRPWTRLKAALVCLCLYVVYWAAGSLAPLRGGPGRRQSSSGEVEEQLPRAGGREAADRGASPPFALPGAAVGGPLPPWPPPPAASLPPATVPPGPPPGFGARSGAEAAPPPGEAGEAAAVAAPPAQAEEKAALPAEAQEEEQEEDRGLTKVQEEAEEEPEPAKAHGPTGAPTWLFCASQWQECICEGKVRWGNRDTWVEIRPKAGQSRVRVSCSIKYLRDILPGDDAKHCECQATPGTVFFDSINPSFLPERLADERPHKVASCEIFERGRGLGSCGEREWQATEAFCSTAWRPDEDSAAGSKALAPSTLRILMRAWVEPRFWGNYQRLYNGSGWLARGFVNYYAGAPGGKHARMTEELVRSVHLFSREAIVVVHFGFYTPSSWTSERFPRLVLLNAPPQPPSAGRSFHFNKLRAFVLARVLTGVELDSDQFVAPGIDTMFSLTEREVTKDYPLPILPAHFHPFTHSDGNLGGPALWTRYCPSPAGGRPCKWQTARWGHAHPTWTFWALPFFGRWLRRQLRDETLPARKGGRMPELRVIHVREDEDLLNVGTWEEGGVKQWCKFDLPDPTEFTTLLNNHANSTRCSRGMCGNVAADQSWNPMGVAKVFYTGHHAVNPPVTRRYVNALLEKVKNKDLAPPILFQGGWYKDGTELRKAHPHIKCII